MDASTRQIAVALQEIIKRNKAAAAVETGDEIMDMGFSQGVDAVVEDLEQMLADMGTGFDEHRSERPFIPMGFQLHSVVTH